MNPLLLLLVLSGLDHGIEMLYHDKLVVHLGLIRVNRDILIRLYFRVRLVLSGFNCCILSISFLSHLEHLGDNPLLLLDLLLQGRSLMPVASVCSNIAAAQHILLLLLLL